MPIPISLKCLPLLALLITLGTLAMPTRPVGMVRASQPEPAAPTLTTSSALLVTCANGDHYRLCRDIYWARVPLTPGYRWLYLNLYRPIDVGHKPYALLIYIPGGGYVIGDRSNCPGEQVAQQGYALACIEYRHSIEETFPAQIQDVKRAVRWLRAHARTYDLDPGRFGVWGDSAGGHLAALLGTSDGAEALEGKVGYIYTSSRVQAVVDWFGLTDFSRVPVLFDDTLTWPVQQGIQDAHYKNKYYLYNVITNLLIGGAVSMRPDVAQMANPLAYIDPTDPPFLIVHGEKDDLIPIDQSQALADALSGAGVPVTFLRDPGRGHEAGPVGGGGGYDPYLIEMTLAFFDQYLYGRVPIPTPVPPATAMP